MKFHYKINLHLNQILKKIQHFLKLVEEKIMMIKQLHKIYGNLNLNLLVKIHFVLLLKQDYNHNKVKYQIIIQEQIVFFIN